MSTGEETRRYSSRFNNHKVTAVAVRTLLLPWRQTLWWRSLHHHDDTHKHRWLPAVLFVCTTRLNSFMFCSGSDSVGENHNTLTSAFKTWTIDQDFREIKRTEDSLCPWDVAETAFFVQSLVRLLNEQAIMSYPSRYSIQFKPAGDIFALK